MRRDTSWVELGARAGEPGERFSLRLVRPRPEERYVDCVPLVPLKAAAGGFGDPQNVAAADWNLVEVKTHHRLRAEGRSLG